MNTITRINSTGGAQHVWHIDTISRTQRSTGRSYYVEADTLREAVRSIRTRVPRTQFALAVGAQGCWHSSTDAALSWVEAQEAAQSHKKASSSLRSGRSARLGRGTQGAQGDGE
jgi:hypothetical protein